ncbi:LysR family transcriptional regulator [Bosea sp. 2YAB26]|uniref:LysR family transcriptional regulator n=1 Tax=Bosea sp. 2YAB26 TaxID=3237478 RepID=UPI003F9393A5
MKRVPGLTLRRLEVFIAIAEGGGFRAAAERLGVAQPSISSHVQALEAQSGGALFERRRGRGVELTDLGKTFLSHARQLLAEADDMVSDLSRFRAVAERRVVFACQRSLSQVLPPLLANFAGEHKEVELITRVGRQEEIVDMIRNGTANIGLFLGEQDIQGLRATTVGHMQLAIAAAPEHPLARRQNIPPAELSAYPFVGAPDGSLLGQGIAALLAGIGVSSVDLVSKATEFEFLRALVIGGVGLYCCVLDRVAADFDSGALVMLSLDAPPLTMEMRQVFSVTKPVSPAVALFAEHLRRQLAAHNSKGDKRLPIT